MPIATGLRVTETDNGTVTELLTTSESAFSKIAGYDLTSYEKEEGDVDGPFTVAVSVESAGGYRAALDNHRKYKAYTDSLTNEKKINRLNNLRLKYITEKGNKEKEIISQAYNDEQQQKQVILYSLITVILVSAAAISLLIYALRVKAKMQNVIKKASRARQEFFTNVTHEFRTPLTVILGSAQELKAKARTASSSLDLSVIFSGRPLESEQLAANQASTSSMVLPAKKASTAFIPSVQVPLPSW